MEAILQFNYPINQSCQEGDAIYYVPQESLTGYDFDINTENQDIVEFGSIMLICNGTITSGVCTEDAIPTTVSILCDIGNITQSPTTTDFIFFGKERSVNEASIVGYYGEFKFLNNSKSKAELFSTSCEITESSN
tara:strand:- start:9142 stop:9546 length:405 start_codon:yes stop_codon:yes gene_type:complete